MCVGVLVFLSAVTGSCENMACCLCVGMVVYASAKTDARFDQDGATRPVCHREVRVQLQHVGVRVHRHFYKYPALRTGVLRLKLSSGFPFSSARMVGCDLCLLLADVHIGCSTRWICWFLGAGCVRWRRDFLCDSGHVCADWLRNRSSVQICAFVPGHQVPLIVVVGSLKLSVG
jgi:hypothetical protein